MKKEKHSDDKISEQTLHEILLQIKYTLNHLEDITADDRALLVKLVKQNNKIVEFLRELQYEEVVEEEIFDTPTTDPSSKYKHINDLVQEFMDKKESLKELEKELKKHKDKITPGQVGEA